jgi:hypothetical protein
MLIKYKFRNCDVSEHFYFLWFVTMLISRIKFIYLYLIFEANNMVNLFILYQKVFVINENPLKRVFDEFK